ncbi:MAG: hypothetical protein SFZ24_09185 [Planctomycetota bacterium]|nr:hypothetical protein [Planctomycetota bacterium]
MRRSGGGSSVRGVMLGACLLAALGAAVGGLTACNIVGPIVAVASPPPSTPAQLELDPVRSHAILIDDLSSRLPKRSLRNDMVQSAQETLLANKALTPEQLIDSKGLQRALSDDMYGQARSIVEIGRKAGAQVVIHVAIDGWGLSRDLASASPFVEARVKVLDCDANNRIWPPMEQGYTLIVAPKMDQGNLPTTLAEKSKMERDLAKRFGVALAQLFYKHLNEDSARE